MTAETPAARYSRTRHPAARVGHTVGSAIFGARATEGERAISSARISSSPDANHGSDSGSAQMSIATRGTTGAGGGGGPMTASTDRGTATGAAVALAADAV